VPLHCRAPPPPATRSAYTQDGFDPKKPPPPSDALATSYVAPVSRIAIQKGMDRSYATYLAVGTLAEIRAAFYAVKKGLQG
jgi:hypothetical protein